MQPTDNHRAAQMKWKESQLGSFSEIPTDVNAAALVSEVDGQISVYCCKVLDTDTDSFFYQIFGIGHFFFFTVI